MPARDMIEATPDQWRRVADSVRARRKERNLTLAEVAALSRLQGYGVSETTLSNLERATKLRYERQGLHAIARVLGWEDDAVERLLSMAEPIERNTPPRVHTGEAHLVGSSSTVATGTVGSVAERVARLEAQMAAVHQTLLAIAAEIGITVQQGASDAGE